MKGRRLFDPAGDCRVWFAKESQAEEWAKDSGVDYKEARKHMVVIEEEMLGKIFEFPATWVSIEEG